MEIRVRYPRVDDEEACAALAAKVLGPARAAPFVKDHFERHRILVAEAEGEVVGFLAWRLDWFDCAFVDLVFVKEEFRRRGIAREFFRAVEAVSPSPRIFSSVEETNTPAIRMHAALGFSPSGSIENLPQGVRELLFFRRVPPRAEPRGTPPRTMVLGDPGAADPGPGAE